MTEYVNPSTVEPGRAGTATVRGVKGVRVIATDPDDYPYPWKSATYVLGQANHDHADIRDLVLDTPVPADSVVITREHLSDWRADPSSIRKYASDLRREGRAAAADLLDIIADKLAALPKPVPPKPEGQVVAFVDERFWHPTDDGGWLPVEGSDDDAPTWADLVEIARKEDRRDPVVYRAEGIS